MDASRLLGDGTPVALSDGEKVTVRFDFEAIIRLETTFGSTFEFAKQLDARQSGRLFSAVLGGMQAGVKERKVIPADLEPADVMVYRSALVDAWLEAMPEPAVAGKAKGRAGDGTGDGSTTSAPSGSADPKPTGDA